MAYTPKDGSGALFKSDKGDNPARPDYRGDLMVGGVLYEISAWIKPLPSDSSKRFMSMSAKPKQAQQRPASRPSHDAAKARQLPKQGSGFDDWQDAPF